MHLFRFFGLARRVRRYCFILFLLAAVYAGPRFAKDVYNEVRPTSPTTTTTSARAEASAAPSARGSSELSDERLEFLATFNAELAHHAVQMRLDRAHRQDQLLSDLGVRHTARGQDCDFAFALA